MLFRSIRAIAGGRSLWQFYRDSRQSELIVVLAEDIAALAGLLVAFVSLLLSLATGNPVFDALGSMVVGGILVLISLTLMREIYGLMIGQSAGADIEAELSRFIEARPEVRRLYRLITLQMGPYVMLACKVHPQQEQQAIAGCLGFQLVVARSERAPGSHDAGGDERESGQPGRVQDDVGRRRAAGRHVERLPDVVAEGEHLVLRRRIGLDDLPLQQRDPVVTDGAGDVA